MSEIRITRSGTKNPKKHTPKKPKAKQLVIVTPKKPRQRPPRNKNNQLNRAVLGTSKGKTFDGARVITSNRHRMIIEQCEFQNIKTPTAVGVHETVVNLGINPGLPSTFPWLAKVAAGFEKYRFRKLEFFFTPIVGQYSAAGSTGKILCMIDWDSADQGPANKRDYEDSVPHTDGMAYQEFALSANHSGLRKNDAWFVRTKFNPPSTDIKTYDLGTLYVATDGFTVTDTLISELRVRYVVELFNPVLDSNPPIPKLKQVSIIEGLTLGVPGWSTWYDAVLNPVAEFNPLGLTKGVGNGTIIFPNGNFLVHVHLQCNSTTNFNLLQQCYMRCMVGEVAVGSIAMSSVNAPTVYNISLHNVYLVQSAGAAEVRIQYDALGATLGNADVAVYAYVQPV
jgi:hypothetical protein